MRCETRRLQHWIDADDFLEQARHRAERMPEVRGKVRESLPLLRQLEQRLFLQRRIRQPEDELGNRVRHYARNYESTPKPALSRADGSLPASRMYILGQMR